MASSEHILAHPGDIIINGVPYKLDINPRSNPPNQLAWEEEPILRGSEPKAEKNLTHTRIGTNAWLSEQIIDTWDDGMGDAIRYEHGTYHYGDNVDASYPGQVILSPLRSELTVGVSAGTDPTGFFFQDGRLYAQWGRYIREIDNFADNMTDTADKDFGAGRQVKDAKLFNAVAVVALGNGEVFQTRAAGAAPGTYATAAAGLTADFFAVNESFLYRADSDSSNSLVYACDMGDDPTLAASWSAPVSVGGNVASFTDLETYGFQLLIGRIDGLYRTNRLGFTPNLMEEFKALISTANGLHMVKFSDVMIIPYFRGVLRYDGTRIQEIGPDKLGGIGPVFGIYWASTSDAKWYYGAIHNGTDTYIVRYTEKNGKGIWHTYTTWTSNQVTGLYIHAPVSNTGTPYLMASSTTNELISRWILTVDTAHPFQTSSAYTYAASGNLFMPRIYMGSQENTKRFLDVVVEGDDLSATETLAFKYRVTASIPWSSSSPAFTTLVTATSSPTTTALNVSGIFIEPLITFARQSSPATVTPVLRRIKIRALQFPTFYRSVKCRIVLPPDAYAYEGGDTIGSIDDNTPETSYGLLRTLRATSSSFTVIDPWGVSRTMYIASAERAQPILPDDPHEEPKLVIELMLVEAPS